jgi:hypothetical protein
MIRRALDPHPVMAAIVLCLISIMAGCVSFSRGGIFPEDRNEVFLAYFENETFYRDVEFELTERITQEILSRPGLMLSSKEDAEVLLTGRVVSVRQVVLSEDPKQDVTSRSTNITAVIEIRDARTGDLIKTKKLTQRGEFVDVDSNVFSNLDLDAARREAYVFLARDIVRELEKEF